MTNRDDILKIKFINNIRHLDSWYLRHRNIRHDHDGGDGDHDRSKIHLRCEHVCHVPPLYFAATNHFRPQFPKALLLKKKVSF